jgi:hypothetical protein
MQAVADEHDTAFSWPATNENVEGGDGGTSGVHETPSQISANGTVFVPPVSIPTATHTVAVGHETPLSWLPVIWTPSALVGIGVCCSDQADPFQLSANDCAE